MDGNSGLIMLMQLIATLFGYADLAEATVSQSRRRRAHMLGLLRYREAVALQCVVQRMRSSGMPFPALYALMPDSDGDTPEDALALAARFRALAMILMQLAAAYCAARDPFPRVLADRSAIAVSAMMTVFSVIAKPALPRSCFDTC